MPLDALDVPPVPCGVYKISSDFDLKANVAALGRNAPVRTRSSFIRSKFQILMTPSSAPVTNLSSFGAQLASRTDSL